MRSIQAIAAGLGEYKRDEAYHRMYGDYRYWVIDSDNGWLVERDNPLDDTEEILSSFLLDMPVLCPTYAIAARLASHGL